MTHLNREVALEEYFHRYRKCKRGGARNSAAVYLAQIFRAIPGLPAAQQAVWNSRIEKELSDEFVQEIRRGLKESIERTHRILSIGTVWTGEEIMLVMQLRIEIKLVSDFLGDGIAVELLGQLKQIDDQLATLEKSVIHSDSFKWGLRQMKKHWMSDIELVWRSLIDPL